MITGSINAYGEATIRFTVLGMHGQFQEIEAIIDTGFTGFLTLPSSVVTTLGLAWRTRSRVTLADNSERLVDIYEANVVWDGLTRRITVDAVDTDPLVGMALLNGYELTIQATRDGRGGHNRSALAFRGSAVWTPNSSVLMNLAFVSQLWYLRTREPQQRRLVNHAWTSTKNSCRRSGKAGRMQTFLLLIYAHYYVT